MADSSTDARIEADSRIDARLEADSRIDARLEAELGKYRIRPDLDIFLVPNFLRDVLKHDDAKRLQTDLEAHYPVRRAGDKIVPNTCQWVEGTNDALKYRGNTLKRTKIWLQRGDPQSVGYAYYYYTGVQWEVVPAQTDWDTGCPEIAELVPGYDKWCASVGAKPASQCIVTAYRNGDHFIGPHFDKARSIAPSDTEGASLITVVKMGACARPFELYLGDAPTPFWSERVPPGAAIIMTLEANLATKHAVPVVTGEEVGPSGSLVFRSIARLVPPDELQATLVRTRAAKARSKAAKAGRTTTTGGGKLRGVHKN